MARDRLLRRLRQPFRDFILGLGVCAAVAASGIFERGTPQWLFAHSAHAGWESQLPVDALFQLDIPLAALAPDHGPDQLVPMLIAAVVLSGMLAFNLWFARHLRQVAVSYRRRHR